jgi:hypothetical protein
LLLTCDINKSLRDDHHIYRNPHGPYRPRIYKAMGLDILNVDESGIKYYLYRTKE